MPESVLPGVTIEVRAEGLIIPGRISVGTLGVVGTADKGPLNEPTVLGSAAEARAVFGIADAWTQTGNPLTLVRALELAFDQGAQRAIAVRISGTTGNPPVSAAQPAEVTIKEGQDDAVTLTAASPGTWGNGIVVTVRKPTTPVRLPVTETITVAAGTDPKLSHSDIQSDPRTRILVTPAGSTVPVSRKVVSGTPQAGEVQVAANGTLTFSGAEKPVAGDRLDATYIVGEGDPTVRSISVVRGDATENYLAVDPAAWPKTLSGSALIGTVTVARGGAALPDVTAPLTGGSDGAETTDIDYQTGLGELLDQDAHIIVPAGQGQDFADELANHCRIASSDAWQRERIGVVGTTFVAASAPTERSDPGLNIAPILGHAANSDRVILVGPGLRMTDASVAPPAPVLLPAAFTAAAFAGLLSSFDPHVSPTNKPLGISGLEVAFTRTQLEQLVAARATVVERRQGYLVVKGVTTSTNTAWTQITTRRIVDYARLGVRSAALPYIGLLNNARVRTALRATINSFLTDMLNAEMLTDYQVEVSATRDEEIKGIARVTLTLRPTFSIDYIQVTIFLQ